MSKSKKGFLNFYRRPGQSGFTLMEVLVVLVLMGVLSSLLFQGFGQVLIAQNRIGDHVDNFRVEALAFNWFRSVNRAIVSTVKGSPEQFIGETTQIKGLSLDSLGGSPGVPGLFEWTIEPSKEGTQLLYQERNLGPWLMYSWPNRQASFQYMNSQRVWFNNWPPDENSDEPQMPQAIRVTFAGMSEMGWFVARVGDDNARSNLLPGFL